MDDIKLFCSNERDIDLLIHLSTSYYKRFRFDKCSRMLAKRAKVGGTEGVELPDGRVTDIPDSFKYLGIPQANGNHKEAARRSATAKYLQRVRQVLRSQLNGKNKIQAVNTYALPVVRYPAGIIRWSRKDIKATGIRTRKHLTMYRGFHLKFGSLRLYDKRKYGGRGLVSIRADPQVRQKEGPPG